MASSLNNKTVVSLLLREGSDVNSEVGYYGNALQAASYSGHEEIVRFLLKSGVNVNARGGHYGNALQAASKSGYRKIVQLLLENGADINARGGIHVNALCAATVDIGFRNFGFWTYNHEDIIAILLEKGADVNAQGEGNRTPVDNASRCGAKAIVQLLLDKGAIVNITTMEAAIDSDSREVDGMIYKALKQRVTPGTLEAKEMYTKRRQARKRAEERITREVGPEA